MFFYTYMLKSLNPGLNKTYVGYTKDIKSRLNKHNNNKGARSTKGHKWILIYKKRLKNHNDSKGAKFTRGRKWKLKYFKGYEKKNIAMREEYKLKKNYKLRKKIKLGDII